MPELTTRESRERRRNAAQHLAAGSAMIGGSAVAMDEVKRRTGVKGPVHALKDINRGGLKAKHGKYAAGWLGTRGVAAAGIPLAAGGAAGLLSRRPRATEPLNVREDVIGEAVDRTLPAKQMPRERDERTLKQRITSHAPVAGGAALGGLGGSKLSARFAPKGKLRVATRAVGAGLGAAGGAAAAVPITRRAVEVGSKGNYEYDPRRGLSRIGKAARHRNQKAMKRQLQYMLDQEERRYRAMGYEIKKLPNGDFTARPPKIKMYSSYDDWKRDQVRKSQPGAIRELPRNEQQKLISQKKKQSKYSLASAGLGLSAFGLKTPALVGMATKRSRRLAQIKPVSNFAARAPKADPAATNLGIASLGVGGMGSLNFARIQRAETKADQRATGIKKAIGDRPRKKGERHRMLVTGSRDWDDPKSVDDYLGRAWEKRNLHIIEGGATGADAHAREWAKTRGVKNTTYPAEWKKHGRRAGPLRNQRMIDEGQPHRVVAFHRDLANSKGTGDMVRRARKAGLRVDVVDKGRIRKDDTLYLRGNRVRSEDVAKALFPRPRMFRPTPVGFGGVTGGGFQQRRTRTGIKTIYRRGSLG